MIRLDAGAHFKVLTSIHSTFQRFPPPQLSERVAQLESITAGLHDEKNIGHNIGIYIFVKNQWNLDKKKKKF